MNETLIGSIHIYHENLMYCWRVPFVLYRKPSVRHRHFVVKQPSS